MFFINKITRDYRLVILVMLIPLMSCIENIGNKKQYFQISSIGTYDVIIDYVQKELQTLYNPIPMNSMQNNETLFINIPREIERTNLGTSAVAFNFVNISEDISSGEYRKAISNASYFALNMNRLMNQNEQHLDSPMLWDYYKLSLEQYDCISEVVTGIKCSAISDALSALTISKKTNPSDNFIYHDSIPDGCDFAEWQTISIRGRSLKDSIQRNIKHKIISSDLLTDETKKMYLRKLSRSKIMLEKSKDNDIDFSNITFSVRIIHIIRPWLDPVLLGELVRHSNDSFITERKKFLYTTIIVAVKNIKSNVKLAPDIPSVIGYSRYYAPDPSKINNDKVEIIARIYKRIS